MSVSRYYIEEKDMPALVLAAYDLSVPQGMGFLHAKHGPLDDATVAGIVATEPSHGQRLTMDYVHGRAVKLRVRLADDGRPYISAENWYDHSDAALRELAGILGLVVTQE